MRVGMLGGTFNPPHNGHMTAAQNVQRALSLDLVLLVPTNIPPHKQLPQGSATTAQRCDMVRLLAGAHDWLQFCDIEVAREGVSYTVDTLRALSQVPDYTELVLIMGTDMLLGFDSIWRAPETIATLATLAVVARADDQMQILHEKAEQLRLTYGATIEIVQGDVLECSSTQLREQGGMDKLTPPTVAQYIRTQGLYGATPQKWYHKLLFW